LPPSPNPHTRGRAPATRHLPATTDGPRRRTDPRFRPTSSVRSDERPGGSSLELRSPWRRGTAQPIVSDIASKNDNREIAAAGARVGGWCSRNDRRCRVRGVRARRRAKTFRQRPRDGPYRRRLRSWSVRASRPRLTAEAIPGPLPPRRPFGSPGGRSVRPATTRPRRRRDRRRPRRRRPPRAPRGRGRR
jgi:hypothetical protein